jgi:two-component system, cell cycle response regulator DivK
MAKTRILIMEDDDDTQGMVRFLLEYKGYDVLAAKDGRHGLEIARQEKPDLILLDLAMPEMDGWSVAHKLKDDPQTKTIPVIAVTAYTMSSDRRKALNAGCDGFIGKPMNVPEFIAEVEKFLGKSQTE